MRRPPRTARSSASIESLPPLKQTAQSAVKSLLAIGFPQSLAPLSRAVHATLQPHHRPQRGCPIVIVHASVVSRETDVNPQAMNAPRANSQLNANNPPVDAASST